MPGSGAATSAAERPSAISLVTELQLAPAVPQPQRQQGRLAPASDAEQGRTGKQIEEAALRSALEWRDLHPNGLELPNTWPPGALDEAYERCGVITKDYAKTFYLVSLLDQHELMAAT